ncbi:5'-3' exoribonuclease 2 [Dendrobium catenatum]|uniref:5'-3' exoribonuclease 2 n=1 Tax=Dendrobium catenatum TaxID=906689 RepID=A0A2I0W8J1_9ASPA|nr:5'-3' exoribonuclease 2 [Dendrobium catenatum]
MIKLDVLEAVKDFFVGNPYPIFFSFSNIILIPKKEVVNNWNDFRLISLCFFFNKLISKTILSRLVNILLKIIFYNQTGFVKGRGFFDSVLLAQEITHDIIAKVKGGNIIFKLDFTKAYDNMNWNFLYTILFLFGFSQSFILFISNNIENCYFSMIINGRNHNFFKSFQGLRQGDPLSHALFIIIVEYLSMGIEELYKRYLKPFFHTISGLPITHLSFADNFIIFLKGTINNIKVLVNFFLYFKICVFWLLIRKKEILLWLSQLIVVELVL